MNIVRRLLKFLLFVSFPLRADVLKDIERAFKPGGTIEQGFKKTGQDIKQSFDKTGQEIKRGFEQFGGQVKKAFEPQEFLRAVFAPLKIDIIVLIDRATALDKTINAMPKAINNLQSHINDFMASINRLQTQIITQIPTLEDSFNTLKSLDAQQLLSILSKFPQAIINGVKPEVLYLGIEPKAEFAIKFIYAFFKQAYDGIFSINPRPTEEALAEVCHQLNRILTLVSNFHQALGVIGIPFAPLINEVNRLAADFAKLEANIIVLYKMPTFDPKLFIEQLINGITEGFKKGTLTTSIVTIKNKIQQNITSIPEQVKIIDQTQRALIQAVQNLKETAQRFNSIQDEIVTKAKFDPNPFSRISTIIQAAESSFKDITRNLTRNIRHITYNAQQMLNAIQFITDQVISTNETLTKELNTQFIPQPQQNAIRIIVLSLQSIRSTITNLINQILILVPQ